MNHPLGTQAHQQKPGAIPMASGLLQRKCACGKHSAGGECEECSKKKQALRRNATDRSDASEVPPVVHEVLRSAGQPLDPVTRAFMEPRFGHDFSQVRVHTDAKAVESARAVNAFAYTVGQSVVFGAGQFAPETRAGRKLLAHELTHTIQQSGNPAGGVQMASSLEVSDPGDSYEREAEAQATSIVEGHGIKPVSVQGRLGVARLQRQADIRQAPPGLPCVLTTGPGHLPGTDVLFSISSSGLMATGRADIATFASAWVAGGSRDDVMVDGWASVDGAQSLNWRLSCERAESVKAELGRRGVPAGKVTTLAHGESTEFSTTDLVPNRRAIITRQPAVGPTPTPPTPTPPTPTPAPAETITSQTVVTSPGARTRTTIGVGEEVNLTHSPGSATWSTTEGAAPLSATRGTKVLFTAPDTSPATTKRITVTAGAATIVFDVLAPTSVAQSREPGTGVKHTKDQPDSGIASRTFLGPDTVNFNKVRWRELDVAGVVTPGVYSCNPASGGHCGAGGGGAPCADFALSDTVVAGKGTQDFPPPDCAYSGHCGTAPPFAPGSITLNIPYEYKVGTGAFHRFFTVTQQHVLAADSSTLMTTKAGASGTTTVATATTAIAQCP